MSPATFMVLVKARGVRCPGIRGSDKEAAGRMESKNRNQLASQGRCQHRRGSQEQGVGDMTAWDLVSSSHCRGRSGGSQAQTAGPHGSLQDQCASHRGITHEKRFGRKRVRGWCLPWRFSARSGPCARQHQCSSWTLAGSEDWELTPC